MHFIHDPYVPGETITAVATPPGEGGVAIVRVTGDKALEVVNKIFSGNVLAYQSHTAHFGHVLSLKGDYIDDAIVLVMLGKRSYAGEDTVEIQCHGGSLITKRVLEATLKAGARMAKPGEFTFKAFMNKKIDLTQAEAIQNLIGAKSERALDAAKEHLQGKLSSHITIFQKELNQLAAILDAWIDFPEEGLEFISFDQFVDRLEKIRRDIEKLLTTFHDGRLIHDGLNLCLIGLPNVGKSSLMNALLDKERAIVSHIEGTTRDVVEDLLILNGMHVRLVDTAGIRNTNEEIEKEGIKRSQKAMEKADITLFVVDASLGLREEEKALLESIKTPFIVVWNKSDLRQAPLDLINSPSVSISAKENQGIEQLKKVIDETVFSSNIDSKEEILLTNLRHKEALENSQKALFRLINGLKTEISPEFLAFEMRMCLSELGKVIGRDISEDILDEIFSSFCIGK